MRFLYDETRFEEGREGEVDGGRVIVVSMEFIRRAGRICGRQRVMACCAALAEVL